MARMAHQAPPPLASRGPPLAQQDPRILPPHPAARSRLRGRPGGVPRDPGPRPWVSLPRRAPPLRARPRSGARASRRRDRPRWDARRHGPGRLADPVQGVDRRRPRDDRGLPRRVRRMVGRVRRDLRAHVRGPRGGRRALDDRLPRRRRHRPARMRRGGARVQGDVPAPHHRHHRRGHGGVCRLLVGLDARGPGRALHHPQLDGRQHRRPLGPLQRRGRARDCRRGDHGFRVPRRQDRDVAEPRADRNGHRPRRARRDGRL